MKRRFYGLFLRVVLFFSTILVGGLMAQPDVITRDLMPVPAKAEYPGGEYRLTTDFLFKVEGTTTERLNAYATRVLRRLSGRTGLFILQDDVSNSDTLQNAQFTIKFQREGSLKVGEDESYNLTVSEQGVRLEAVTDFGAMRGLETLLQLIDKDEEGYFLPFAKIEDKPFYKWRGLMIDPCRHWMPMEMILRNLDGMAMMKMNVMHFHLSEDQGFRIESKVFPKLTEFGSDGNYFTQDQIKQIIKYAADRGIRVYPEFDVPGHTTAWFAGHPELASQPGPYKIERRWGVFGPVMDPTKESTYEFLDKLFTEMAGLFPDEYFHIGGDEVKPDHWKANQDIQKFMKDNNIADEHALQAYFNKRILKILQKNNKKMVGWDEILQPDMPNEIVIQSWRGKKALLQASKEGYKVILSNGYYIDLSQPTWFHYTNHPISPDTTLPAEQMENILGGEATMWAEMVSNETVDSKIWPRTAAIAERFWSSNQVNDVEDMYRRLDIISVQLEEVGLFHEKNYPMMLRRLTGGEDIAPLKMLVDILEPVKLYERHRLGVKYTQLSPLTRVVDASRPDSKVAREFNALVERYIEHKEGWVEEKLIEQIVGWSTNMTALKVIISRNPILEEIQPHAQTLEVICEMMPELIDMVGDGRKLSPDKLKLLDDFRSKLKPFGQTELMILKGFNALVTACTP